MSGSTIFFAIRWMTLNIVSASFLVCFLLWRGTSPLGVLKKGTPILLLYEVVPLVTTSPVSRVGTYIRVSLSKSNSVASPASSTEVLVL